MVKSDVINASVNTVALVPLRGGSKGIVGKNVKLFNGKPLCVWVLEAALKSKVIDRVYVSTDSSEISLVVQEYLPQVFIIDRPSCFASDEASTESVMLHFMQHVSFQTLVLLQATSPLTRYQDIDGALLYMQEKQLDSLVSAVRQKRFYWTCDGEPINYDPLNRPRRQDFKGCLVENGAIYITTKSILEQYQNRLGGKMGVYEMPEDTFEELDDILDWDVAELRMRLRHDC